jgi:hypothetical protein
MWNQLGVFGSRVVEAISVASVETTTSVETTSVETRMEGHDANALIASRMGIEPGEVTAKLVTLHQKNELNGAADGRAERKGKSTSASLSGTWRTLRGSRKRQPQRNLCRQDSR